MALSLSNALCAHPCAASINRLKFSFERVSDAHRARLKELQVLMDPTKSFQQYRKAYSECGLGIPYLGASLTDLLFIEGTWGCSP